MPENEKLSVQFLGAAGTVTGSKFLLEYGQRKILVDCGLFQGKKEWRRLNWQPLPFDVASLECVLLTHGHLDHVGHLPLLVRQGFRGPIYATQPTIDIARLILLDSAKIHEEDAKRANEHGYSRHRPAKPLYDSDDVAAVLPLFRACPLDERIAIGGGASFRMRYNGHILGSVFIELTIGGSTLVFSGDLGRPVDPLLYPPRKPVHADVLFLEGTYGNRTHEPDPEQALADAINRAVTKNGVILIPGFAVERIQLLMYFVGKLLAGQRIPRIPVYLDSPMAAEMTEVFTRYPDWHRLKAADYADMQRDVRTITSAEETEKIVLDRTPKIVIAAAGMASGGRILTYFDYFIEDPRTTVIFTGHQAEGTRGHAMLNGASHIKLHGFFLDVEADVVQVGGLSAHADRAELTSWLSDLEHPPKQVFIVHAEEDGATGLQQSLSQTYGYSCSIPRLFERLQVGVHASETLRV